MQNILVATDFSTRSDRALRRGSLLAGELNASLTLVHVVDDDQPPYVIDRQRAIASDMLSQTAATIRQVDGVSARALTVGGDAFAGILQAAEEIDADLIVIGPHRRQLVDVFVGTTAERTIRRSRWPVLMANGLPSGPYTRSLVAVDLDEVSEAAVVAAKKLSLLGPTEVVALHLFDAPALGMMRRTMGEPEALEHYRSVEEARAREELSAWLQDVGLERTRSVLRPWQGSPASLILSSADEEHADLIVVGTHQRKGLGRFFLGSVAEQVLLDATQDVLVVPRREAPRRFRNVAPETRSDEGDAGKVQRLHPGGSE